MIKCSYCKKEVGINAIIINIDGDFVCDEKCKKEYEKEKYYCTGNIIPCGAIEEFMEIVENAPNPLMKNFYINLKGHGSIVLATDINYFKEIKYKKRRIGK